jgi:hypothetical protein
VGEFYRRAICEVVLGCEVAVMEHVTRGSGCDGGEGGLVLPAMMAAVGALQRGCGAVVVRCKGGVWCGGVAHGGGHTCRGHG